MTRSGWSVSIVEGRTKIAENCFSLCLYIDSVKNTQKSYIAIIQCHATNSHNQDMDFPTIYKMFDQIWSMVSHWENLLSVKIEKFDKLYHGLIYMTVIVKKDWHNSLPNHADLMVR